MIDEAFHFGRFNQTGPVKTLDRGFFRKEGRRQQDKNKQHARRTAKLSSIHPHLPNEAKKLEDWNDGRMEHWV